MTDTRTTVTAHRCAYPATGAQVAEEIGEILEGHEPRDISDSSALAIASWWMGPRGYAAVLAQFATTGSADAAELLDAISDTRADAMDDLQALAELDHLEAWVIGRADTSDECGHDSVDSATGE